MQPSYVQRWPELKEFVADIRKILNDATRPAEEVLLTDCELQKMLSVSKRTTATWRANRMIAYTKIQGIIIYKLSDILEFVNKNRVESVHLKKF